jgi:hypothetical protein
MAVDIAEGGPDNRTSEVGEYKTTDIEQAATLMTIGHKFVRLDVKKEPRNPKRMWFVFDTKKVKDDLTKYLNSDLSVCPRVLLNNLSDLKNLVHNKDFE